MIEDKDESIINHIQAFRLMLIKCLSVLGIILIPMFFAAPYVLNLFIKFILKGNNISLNYFSIVEVFIIQIKTALILSLILSFPYISKQIWNFCVSALYEHERKFIKSIVFYSSLLFILGSLFCLFLILPLLIKFGLSFSSANIQPVFNISNIFGLSLWLILSFGLIFQLPLVTFFLIKSNLTTYRSVSDKRPYVVIGLLIAAAFLTPPDIVSQILLFTPAYLLFELGLLFSRRYK